MDAGAALGRVPARDEYDTVAWRPDDSQRQRDRARRSHVIGARHLYRRCSRPFLAGLLGIIMALCVPAAAWIEASALIIVLISIAPLGIGGVLLWHWHESHSQKA